MFEEKKFLLAGTIAGRARDYGASLLRKGVSIQEVLDKVEEYIIQQGAGIAFPAQISLNAVAAHACSDLQDETTLQEGDIAKIDVGAHVDGHIGDTALTINLSGEYKALALASKKALTNASKLFTPGTPVGEIGRVIQDTITEQGFSPVRNLSGHGLDLYQIHTAPQIPNIHLKDSSLLEEGMTVACEPFATNGKGAIAESGTATVFSFLGKRPVRSAFAREILRKIESYQGMPFASRWLQREFGQGKTKLGLQQLERAGIIQGHPPLKEIGNGMVSQHEHSFLVKDKPLISTKLDD